jgi:hypothetical protein
MRRDKTHPSRGFHKTITKAERERLLREARPPA